MGPGENDAATAAVVQLQEATNSDVRELLTLIEVSQAKATKLDHKFLAYLLDMARIEAQKLVGAVETDCRAN